MEIWAKFTSFFILEEDSMRTAKYHDYTLFRILLFIALIVLGFFAYKHFVNPPCEHTATSWQTTEATCIEEGYRYKVCTKCGEQFANEVLKPTGHKTNSASIVIKEATCTEDGYCYSECIKCDEQLDYEVLKATGHKLDNEVITDKEATCSEEGSGHKICSVCENTIETVKIHMTEHTPRDPVIKNKKHTFAEGASYEEHIFCTE
jgi:hypothetical protein